MLWRGLLVRAVGLVGFSLVLGSVVSLVVPTWWMTIAGAVMVMAGLAAYLKMEGRW